MGDCMVVSGREGRLTAVVSELSDYPAGDMCSRAVMSQLKSVSYASILVFHTVKILGYFNYI